MTGKLLFGQSYYLRFDPKLWDAMQPHPPLGTLYAAAYMRTQGYDVALFDAMLAESEAEWAHALEREQPQFAILYEDNFNYLSKMCLLRMRQAAFTMIHMARKQGCTVIVCGSDATDHTEAYINQGAHFILLGEGEYTLAELMARLTERTQTSFEDILGLAFARETDEGPIVAHNPRRPDIKTLDDLPFPAWDLVDMEQYRHRWYTQHGYFSMNMVTTRGCPYHCNWCAKPIWGQRYNARTPHNVVAELKWIKQTYAPDRIWFMDDIMGLKPGWLAHFAELVEREDAKIPFKCLSRVDLLLHKSNVTALKQAGCEIVWVGAESGSQKILDAMEKGTTVEQIVEATQRLHDVGIQVGFFLQFGYPGETREDIDLTLQMVRDCQPDDIGMSVSYPLPGTRFYENVQIQLGEKQNWQDSNDLAMMYQGEFTTAFYRQLHTVLHKEYRSRKTWHLLWKQRNDMDKSNLPRQIAAMCYHQLTLPWARYRLNQLAKVPHTGPTPFPQLMTHDEAATPTPQQN